MEKNNLKDNQQGSLEHLQFAWLAGLIDGEGNIFINHRNKKHIFTPVVGFFNCNAEMMEYAARILENIGIKYFTGLENGRLKNGNKSGNYLIAIKTSGMKNCLKLLTIIEPYLIGKKEEAQKVLEYCQRRLKEISEWRAKPREKWQIEGGTPANLYAFDYRNQIHQIRKSKLINPSETIRRPSYFRINRKKI